MLLVVRLCELMILLFLNDVAIHAVAVDDVVFVVAVNDVAVAAVNNATVAVS